MEMESGELAASFKEQRAHDWGAPEILPMKRGGGRGVRGLLIPV